jgi:hypothetical protein
MCTSGADWGSYQSLIQLGIGLNLGYSLLETILKSQFDRFTATLSGFVGSLKASESRIDIPLWLQWVTKKISYCAKWVIPVMFSAGVCVGIVLTLVGIALLIYSSENSRVCIDYNEKIFVVLTSVGWVSFYIAFLAFFRALLGLLVGIFRRVS